MSKVSHQLALAAQKGFTLIELVIVLVVLGVLAAFAVPQFVGLNDDADAAGAAANLSSLVTQAYSSTLATGGDLGDVSLADSTSIDLSSDASDSCSTLGADDVFVNAGIVNSTGGGRSGEFTVEGPGGENNDEAIEGAVAFTIPKEPLSGVPQTFVCYISKT